MADISKIKLAGETTARDLKDATARSNLATLMGTGKTAGTDVLGAAAWEAVASTISGTGLVSASVVKDYVDGQVGAINSFDVKIYEAKGGTGSDKNYPKTSASKDTMYILGLVQDSDAEAGTYVEYITVRSGAEGSYTYAWEKIGSTKTDLTGYVSNSRTIAGLDLADDITDSELQTALGLGALAYAATASGTITPAGSISEVDATPAGSVSVVLEDDSAASATITTKAAYTPAGTITGSAISDGSINVTVKDASSATEATLTRGDYTPAGSVAITADNAGAFQVAGTNAASAVTFTGGTTATVLKDIKTAAVAPSFTDNKIGTFVAPELQSGFYSAGTAPSFTQGTKASLGDATKGDFATSGIVAAIDETDTEMLVFSAASTSKAVTEQGTFTANGDDTWSAGTMASIDVSKFSAGSWTAGTFNAGSAAEFNTATVVDNIGTGEAAAQTFTGNKYTPSFTGTKEENLKVTKAEYLKQEIDEATFSGTAATLGFSGTEAADLIPTAITYVPKKVKSATFTGTANKITPTFTGTEGTVTVSPVSE